MSIRQYHIVLIIVGLYYNLKLGNLKLCSSLKFFLGEGTIEGCLIFYMNFRMDFSICEKTTVDPSLLILKKNQCHLSIVGTGEGIWHRTSLS